MQVSFLSWSISSLPRVWLHLSQGGPSSPKTQCGLELDALESHTSWAQQEQQPSPTLPTQQVAFRDMELKRCNIQQECLES